MGTSSCNTGSTSDAADLGDAGGGQLYVSFKLRSVNLNTDLVPYVYGSVPLIGSWDPSKAIPMKREASSSWELIFVLPQNHGKLYFKFLLEAKYESSSSLVEEQGPNRLLQEGKLEEESRDVMFKMDSHVLEYKFVIGVDAISPFDLASGWRAYQNNFEPSAVRGIPDVSINSRLESENQEENASVVSINLTTTTTRSGLGLSKSEGKFSSLQINEDKRDLDIPKLSSPASTIAFGNNAIQLDYDLKKAMPEASGAVAAAVVADRMLGPNEGRQIAIVLVGLPARGKTFTSAKLTRYLRWLGHETKHFNVGKTRRTKFGTNQSAEFFRPDNPEGLEARNEMAALDMEDMLSWMQDGGQVGIFDATNSTRERRNMLMKKAKGKCKIIFLEIICNDESIIKRNILLKIQQSPDYSDVPDFEAALKDFKSRLANYEAAYEPVEEGSYIKMIDMIGGHGGQIQVNNISGYLPGKIVFFLVNTHLSPRPIILTRHGESQDNVRERIGGDSVLSEAGEIYSKKLAKFLEQRLKSEKTASIWTSTLQRSVLTAKSIVGFPKIQWRALDEINAGVCDGMTYEEIKRNMPEEFLSREKDKLRYRYLRGESYLDIIQRLEPVIIELERQKAPVVVISHQAVLRALYAYFADKPLKEIPFIEVPFHTITEIQMGVSGVEEKRYKL